MGTLKANRAVEVDSGCGFSDLIGSQSQAGNATTRIVEERTKNTVVNIDLLIWFARCHINSFIWTTWCCPVDENCLGNTGWVGIYRIIFIEDLFGCVKNKKKQQLYRYTYTRIIPRYSQFIPHRTALCGLTDWRRRAHSALPSKYLPAINRHKKNRRP